MLALGGCATLPKTPMTKSYLDQGKELAAEGDWDRSVQALQKAYNENPEDKEARVLLMRAKMNASLAHLSTGDAFLKAGRFDEAITEFQMAIALDSSNTNAESLLKKAKDMRESDYQTKRGESLMKTGSPAQAGEALETAVKLNPGNKRAQEILTSLREKERRPSPFRTKLDSISPISLKFKETPIFNVFEALTKLSGVNFIFDRDLQDTKVTIFVTDVAFDEFLKVFFKTNKLSSKVINGKSMIIYPDTPAKAREYRDLQIRTFYLASLDTKRAVALLSKVLKSKDVTPNDALNAIVVRGPKELVEVASRIIEANDRPVSEVMLGVEILEVSRTKEQNLGVEYTPSSIGVGLGQSTDSFFNSDPKSDTFKAVGAASLKALSRVSMANVLLSLPTATINLLKQDGDTNILAKPQLRVKNGEKARIHIGERIPLRSNRRVDTTGAVTTDFQYQDIGIKVEVEPNINLHEDINLKLGLEVSALGTNLGTTDDPEYSIQTRTAQSVLNIRAGETVIIGGLINDEERRTVRRVPGIGDIPILGHLFSNQSTNNVKTDVLMAITPVVVRNMEVPEKGLTQIWSGSEEDFSMDRPYDAGAPAPDALMPEEGGEQQLRSAPPVGGGTQGGPGAPSSTPPSGPPPLLPQPSNGASPPLSMNSAPPNGTDHGKRSA